MGFFQQDMVPMIEIYQSEAAELIHEFEEHMLAAERKAGIDGAAVNAFFRIAHTIKGSSAMMGLESLTACTHALEDIFSYFREQPQALIGVQEELRETMYAYADFVKQEAERMGGEAFFPRPADGITSRFQALLRHMKAEQSAPALNSAAKPALKPAFQPTAGAAPDAPPAQPETAQGEPVSVTVRFDNACQMVNVRAYMLLTRLQKQCTVLSYAPQGLDQPGAATELKANGLRIVFASGDPERIMAIMRRGLDVTTAEQEEAEPQEEAREEQAREETPATKEAKYSMVPWNKLMQLQHSTSELVTATTLLSGLAQTLPENRELENLAQSFAHLSAELERVTGSLSMVPMSSVVPRFYRIVHEMCRKEGKEISFQVRGENIEVDKNLIDTMSGPLIHLIRNAVDHGIELPEERERAGKSRTGSITLEVSVSGGTLWFTVTDDGHGLDRQQLLASAQRRGLLYKNESEYSQEEIDNLILLPGFSTNDSVSEYSGRGVGMDVVRSSVEALGGALAAKSKLGAGTAFTLRVPVSSASTDSIRFRCGRHVCLIATTSVKKIYALDAVRGQVATVNGRLLFKSDHILPVLRLRQVWGEEAEEKYLLVMRGLTSTVCLITGDVLGEGIMVEKPLPAQFGPAYTSRTGITGCATLPNGELGLVVNAEKFYKLYQKGDAPM